MVSPNASFPCKKEPRSLSPCWVHFVCHLPRRCFPFVKIQLGWAHGRWTPGRGTARAHHWGDEGHKKSLLLLPKSAEVLNRKREGKERIFQVTLDFQVIEVFLGRAEHLSGGPRGRITKSCFYSSLCSSLVEQDWKLLIKSPTPLMRTAVTDQNCCCYNSDSSCGREHSNSAAFLDFCTTLQTHTITHFSPLEMFKFLIWDQLKSKFLPSCTTAPADQQGCLLHTQHLHLSSSQKAGAENCFQPKRCL